MSVSYDHILDVTGLNCPLPILRTKKELSTIASGETLYIVATDPGSVKDFEAFARLTGHTLVESRAEEGKFHFLLRKR